MRRISHLLHQGLRWGLVALVASFGSGCYINTQRYPKPMKSPADLPPGASNLFERGPEEALVVRHSDPVQIRRPGEVSSFPMHFYSKTARVNTGSWVQSGAGGKVEVLFPGDTSLTLNGRGTAVLGSPARGEPVALFLELDQVRISLGPEEYVRLLGGAVLSGQGGPYVVTNPRDEIMTVTNRSKGELRISFREARIGLAPGEIVHLPLLEAGGGPIERDPAFSFVAGTRLDVQVRGGVDVTGSSPSACEMRVTGPHEVRGLGLVLRLDQGDEVRLDALQPPDQDLPGDAADSLNAAPLSAAQ